MNTPAQDIRIILEDNIDSSSNDLTFGTNLFIGDMPDSPDSCITLIDTPGLEPDPGPYFYDFVQILFRGGVGEYSETMATGQIVFGVLNRYSGTPDSGSYYYAGIWCESGIPAYIGVDERNRPLFSLNLRIQRR